MIFGLVLAEAVVVMAFYRPPATTTLDRAPAGNAVEAPGHATPAEPVEQMSDYDALARRNLTLPIASVTARDIQDSFTQGRSGGKRHEAVDILAPRGTPVHAVEDGFVRKLFNSVPGGLTIYEFDGQSIYCYYYAHLDHYAAGIKEGDAVKRGDVIGYVGTTGDARGGEPHLHFAITKLGPEKHWWQGEAINPYPVLRPLVTK